MFLFKKKSIRWTRAPESRHLQVEVLQRLLRVREEHMVVVHQSVEEADRLHHRQAHGAQRAAQQEHIRREPDPGRQTEASY